MKSSKKKEFSHLERLSLLKVYFCRGQSKSAFSALHGITASSLNLWLTRYSISDLASLHPHLEEYTMPSIEGQLQRNGRPHCLHA